MTDSVNYVISEASWDTNFDKVQIIWLWKLNKYNIIKQYNKSDFEERNRNVWSFSKSMARLE